MHWKNNSTLFSRWDSWVNGWTAVHWKSFNYTDLAPHPTRTLKLSKVNVTDDTHFRLLQAEELSENQDMVNINLKSFLTTIGPGIIHSPSFLSLFTAILAQSKLSVQPNLTWPKSSMIQIAWTITIYGQRPLAYTQNRIQVRRSQESLSTHKTE